MSEVIPGAEPWSFAGGEVGVLVLHGFTGNPWSLRPTAEAFAAAGFAVELPRLPGHGTRWQELNRTTARDWVREARAALETLRARTRCRVVLGLSVGGLIGLHLAATSPEAVQGLVLLNPALDFYPHPLLPMVGLLRWVLPSYAAPNVDDIAMPAVTERAYPRIPVKALHSVRQLQRRVALAEVTSPLLVFTSRRDNVVPPRASQRVLDRVASTDRTQVWLENSLHVATLDRDAPVIEAGAIDFARRVTAAPHCQTPVANPGG